MARQPAPATQTLRYLRRFVIEQRSGAHRSLFGPLGDGNRVGYNFRMIAATKAYRAVRAKILRGDWAPGTRIKEKEVAEMSGVSRTPVREALRRLEAEGLLRFVPNQGAFVASWSAEDAEQTFELRILLESYVAQMAAAKAHPEAIQELRLLAETQNAEALEKKPGHLKRISELNSKFHQRLLQIACSERLESMLSALSNAPLVAQTFRDYEDDDLARSARHHLELVDALQAGDGEWAASVMRSHVIAARRAFRNKHGAPEN